MTLKVEELLGEPYYLFNSYSFQFCYSFFLATHLFVTSFRKISCKEKKLILLNHQ